MIDPAQVQQLLRSAWFRGFALEQCRKYGIRFGIAADPRAVLLTAWHKVMPPQVFESCVSNAHRWDAQEGAKQQSAQHGETEKHQAVLQKLAQELPADRVAKMWKAVPEKSQLRARARAAGVDRWAKDALAKVGWGPLPGMTEGETIVAYMHAINATPALRSDQVFQQLAAATGGAFGDADVLRRTATVIQDLHAGDGQRSGQDALASKVVANQKAREERIAKANGRPSPEQMKANRVDRVRGGLEGDVNTRQAVADALANHKAKAAAKSNGRGKSVYVTTRNKLYHEVARRKTAGESLQGIELSWNLKQDPQLAHTIEGWGNEMAKSEVPAAGGDDGGAERETHDEPREEG